MIRLFVLVGIVGVSLISYLVVFEALPETQLPPAKSLLTEFQALGVVPDPNAVVPNEELGHEIFQVPEEDGIHLAAAEEAMGSMAGMEGMSGMKMDGDAAMKPKGEASMPMDGDAMKLHAEEPTGRAHADEEEEGEGHGGGAGLDILAEGAPVDREIEIVMTEWAYSPGSIDVKPGERILLKIRNGGQIPHEFMFMSMPAMAAVGYRAQRADWNLLEHEALYERSLVLPGQDFQVAVEIQEPGVWMFMCMFPYHMQFGMMGGMATPGMSMQGMAM